jgi:hypothetical protein
MKYQALKRLKTKSKLLKICDTLQEAHEVITSEGAKFQEFSYMGGFPLYKDDKHTYSIQGAVMLDVGGHIVCSLDPKELTFFNFNE